MAAPASAESGGSHWTIGPYEIALTTSDTDSGPLATFTVARGGKQIYRMTDTSFSLNPTRFFVKPGPGAASGDTQRPYRVGADLLGLGAPTLVVLGFDGGPTCCYDLTILVLGDRFRALAPLELLDSGGARFSKIPGRRTLALSFADWTFGGWRTYFAASSAPTAILSYDAEAGRYQADAALMRTPLPPPDRLAAWVREARAADEDATEDGRGFVPQEITQRVLDLIFAGHLDAARKFLDAAWVGPATGREDYWSDLTKCQLRLSPFWPTVARLNALPALKPVEPCSRYGVDHPPHPTVLIDKP
ncbi:MAG TPA: hypothetical protein VMF53_14175 [Alphaproteobacteria bacterium]|nr:hypothetical protein [Alphaproteobacteria bacterium]